MASMSPRARLLSATGLVLLLLSLAALVWAGLRTAPANTAGASTAPLFAPRFARPPRLALGVLTRGAMPPALRFWWARVTADNVVDLAEVRHRPVVVNFWASWCDPCRREAPLLERTWRAERGRVLFLGVNQNDARNDALAFIRRFALSYPSLREPGDASAIRWGVGGFPVTFFLAPDGGVVAQSIGQLRPAQLQRGIAAARRGRL